MTHPWVPESEASYESSSYVSLPLVGLGMILHAAADEYQGQLKALTARHRISKTILVAAEETALSAAEPTSSLPAGYERLMSRPARLQACQKVALSHEQ